MAQTLVEERKVAWKIQGTGPDPAHWLVVFKKVGLGKILHKVLRPGERFKRPILASAESFEAYAVSADANLRHEFSRKYLSAAQTWTFTLKFQLHFRAQNAERLGLSLSDGDPLERLQEEVANLLSATARRLPWEDMKREGEDFGFRLREAEATYGAGESKTSFRHLQDFADSLGLDLRHLDVLRTLTDSDLAVEKRLKENEILQGIAESDHGVATKQEDRDHEILSQKDQNRIDRETAIARSSQALADELQSLKEVNKVERETAVERSSQALQGMQRLRLILDTVAQAGAQAIHTSGSELRSFEAIHRALTEVQGIQASLLALSGGTAPALPSGADGVGLGSLTPGGTPDLIVHRASPLEATIAEAFRFLRILDENPQDQRRILASVLHLLAEAGLGEDADEEFLTNSRDDLAERLSPVQAAIVGEPREFLDSILDLEGLRQRLA